MVVGQRKALVYNFGKEKNVSRTKTNIIIGTETMGFNLV